MVISLETAKAIPGIYRRGGVGRYSPVANFAMTTNMATCIVPWLTALLARRHAKVRTRTSPPYFRTMRSKLVHGTKSMTCEKSVRPTCIESPTGKTKIGEDVTVRIPTRLQIDTKNNAPKTPMLQH